MRRGQFVWSARPPAITSITLLKISPVHGHIVIYSQDQFCLYLYNVDGRLLARATLHERLGDILISRDGHFIISGGSKNTVVVRHLFK